MPAETVDNQWFTAEFPASVTTTVGPMVECAQTTEFAAEMEPFGIFTIRVTQMPVAPFIAVGPRGWVEHFGAGLMRKLADLDPQIVRDHVDAPTGTAVRQMAMRITYEGPCAVYASILAHPSREVGRVLECSAIVEQGSEWQATALRFLNSVQAKWSPTR